MRMELLYRRLQETRVLIAISGSFFFVFSVGQATIMGSLIWHVMLGITLIQEHLLADAVSGTLMWRQRRTFLNKA